MTKILMVVAILIGPFILDAQIITTFAGNGSNAYAGDGGPATAASVGEPTSCAHDYEGNIYLTDAANCVIRKISPCGIISTVAGTGGCGYNGDNIAATAAKL